MTRRRAAVGALVGACLLLTFTAAGGALARTEAWVSCGETEAVSHAGLRYEVTNLEVRETDCATAEAVVRSFYSQEIGSSGATVAEGLGCAYGSGGSRVECRSSSGDAYDGPVGVRWEQRGAAAPRRRVAGCHSFTIARSRSQGVAYEVRASGVRRSRDVRCGFARKLLKAAYETGPLEVVRTVYYPPSGRPTYFLRGGWRCGNGAGGAACWNVQKPILNAIPVEGLAHGMAVTAEVSVVRR